MLTSKVRGLGGTGAEARTQTGPLQSRMMTVTAAACTPAALGTTTRVALNSSVFAKVGH